MRYITRDKNYYQSLVRLAIPVSLQGLITFLVNFADNLMVNTLGDAAVSGVYMGSQLQTFIQMFTGGVGGDTLEGVEILQACGVGAGADLVDIAGVPGDGGIQIPEHSVTGHKGLAGAAFLTGETIKYYRTI